MTSTYNGVYPSYLDVRRNVWVPFGDGECTLEIVSTPSRALHLKKPGSNFVFHRVELKDTFKFTSQSATSVVVRPSATSVNLVYGFEFRDYESVAAFKHRLHLCKPPQDEDNSKSRTYFYIIGGGIREYYLTTDRI